MTPSSPAPAPPPPDIPKLAATFAVLAIPLNVFIWASIFFKPSRGDETGPTLLFTFVALLQLICGGVAVISGIIKKRRGPAWVGAAAAVGALIGWAIIAVSFYVQGQGIAAHHAVIEEIVAEVRRIRIERGLEI